MSSPRISELHAHEILDSRGNPTVHVTVTLKNGLRAQASVPSGASTGLYEAKELRDGDKKRYRGLGVKKAVANVNEKLNVLLRGQDVRDLKKIDAAMCELDGTTNKRRLGANAILAVSLACAQAGAKFEGRPLYRHLREVYGLNLRKFLLPTPMLNVINGGRHADSSLDVQEFMIVPVGPRKFSEKLRAGSEIFHALGDLLYANGLETAVGNEGGYAPDLGHADAAFDYLLKAIKKAKYKPGREIMFAVDVAASELYDEASEKYVFARERRKYSVKQLIGLYEEWVDEYPLLSIEDGLSEDAWSDWSLMTERLGKEIMLVGDDLFVTNQERLKKGIELGVANTILIKPNQIGTVSETMETIALAREHGYTVIISHRSGETTDTAIADLAVAVNAEFIKSGAPSRSERLCKYNRLLEIEEELMGM